MSCDRVREEKKALRRTIRTKMRSEWTEEYRQTVSERVCEQIETFLPFVRSHSIAPVSYTHLTLPTTERV